MSKPESYRLGPWAECSQCGGDTRAWLGERPLCMVHGVRPYRRRPAPSPFTKDEIAGFTEMMDRYSETASDLSFDILTAVRGR